MQRNTLMRVALALFAAAALMLTGCGGDDNSMERDLQEMLDAANAQLETLTADLATANSSVEMLTADLATANSSVEMLTADLATANTNLDTANGNVTSLTMQLATATGDTTQLRMDLADAEGERDMYMTQVGTLTADLDTANADVTRLTGELNTAKLRITELETEKQKEDDKKAREDAQEVTNALRDAITTAAGRTATDDPFDPNATDELLTVAASSAGDVAAKRSGYKMTDDVPDAISGFRGVTLTRSRNTLVVYTDIENAASKPMSEVFNGQVTDGKLSYTVGGTGNVVMWSDAVRDNDTNTVTTGKAAVGGAPATPGMTTFAGMVRNVPGTFTCSGAAGSADDCTDTAPPTRNADGSVNPGGDAGTNWSFLPDSPGARVDVQDGNGHLVFGWWLSKNTKGLPTSADVFTDTDLAASANITAADVSGSAVFRGGAAGKYALHDLSGGNSEAGHFTASAMLEADFDYDDPTTTDEEDNVSVSGMISNFRTGDTSRNWTVTLKAPADAAALGETITGGVTEWDLGGSANGEGDWSASFWGRDAAATGDEASYPSAATGEFDAQLGTVGAIIGAFGVNRE